VSRRPTHNAVPPRARARRLLTLVACFGGLLGVVSCGQEEDPEAVIDRAFSQRIDSADVSMTLNLEIQGSDQLSGPVRVQVTGPCSVTGPDRFRSFDYDVALQGGGVSVPPLGLISTGENVFVEAGGSAYEVGEEQVDELNRAIAQGGGGEEPGCGALGVDIAALGINADQVIQEATIEEDAEVAGVETTHVSAAVDGRELLAGLDRAARRASEVAGDTAEVPELSPDELAQAQEAIGEPRFDLFVGKDDGKVRRMTGVVDFGVPQDASAEVGGASGGQVDFTIEFANVDGSQRITPPTDARPLAELTSQLSALSGVLGQGGAGLPELPDIPGLPGAGGDAGGGSDGAEGGSGGAGGGAGSPSAQDLDQYQRCLERAEPGDPQALQECAQRVGP
jgi:hypothetical protein